MCVLLFITIFFYVILDWHYFLRSYFTVLSGRIYQSECTLKDVTTIYGICTFLDCDVLFRNIRLARLVRELDFARYHFYDCTGIYRRSRELEIRSLQGCTQTVLCDEPISLFQMYKINTKLVHWDKRSLFLEHEVITLRDGKVRYYLMSRQYALNENGLSTHALLDGLRGSESKQECPENISIWLHSLEISSKQLRRAEENQNI